jgi:hypothetical protein
MTAGPRHHYSFKRMEHDNELRSRLRERIYTLRAAGVDVSWLYEYQYATDVQLDRYAEQHGLQRRIVEDVA